MKDYKRIIRREIDNENRTIFVIENLEGKEEKVLYSEIDQLRLIAESDKEQRGGYVIQKSSGERLVIKSHDELGNKISDEENNLKKDKFLNPKKYEKKDI